MQDETPSTLFSMRAFIVATVVNIMGSVLLAGMRFGDRMGEFGPTRPSQPTMASILTWIWSPVPMTIQALTDAGQHQTWPFWHGFLSCVTFGLFFAFLIPWFKRPLYP